MNNIEPSQSYKRPISLADGYLEHIRIAAEQRDPGAPYRTFFDNWFAHTQGGCHLTAGERPIWLNNPCAISKRPILSRLAFISPAAQALLDRAPTDLAYRPLGKGRTENTYQLVVDHAVPVSALREMLWELSSFNIQELQSFLSRWYRLGVITAGEDRQLRQRGLTKSMPKAWDGEDALARYRVISLL
jgi:hypothetical protein